jgi:hypothetical protein
MRPALLLALLLALPLAGCSAMAGDTQVVQVTVNDPQAEILIDGRFAGHGFAFEKLSRLNDYHIVARNQLGVACATIESVPSAAETVDKFLVFCCCIGVPSLMTPGTRELQPTELHLVLPLPSDAAPEGSR